MKKIKFNIVIVTGAVSIGLALIAAYFLFNYTLGQITRFQNFNNKLIYLVTKTNADIDHTNDTYVRLIHFIEDKPARYKAKIKKASVALRFSIYKTGKDYKSLFILIKGQKLKTLYVTHLINRAYFKWNNVSKTMLSLTTVSYKRIPPKGSDKYYYKYAVKIPFINTTGLFGFILLSGKKILKDAILVFTIGSIVIIVLLVLVIYLINKFVGLIKMSELRLKLFFYKLPIPSLIFDLETGLIIEANEKAVDYYGYSKEEFVDMSVTDINPFTANEELISFREKALKYGYYLAVFKHKLKNGEIRDVEVYASGIMYNNKPYIQSIINDVTEKLANQKTISERLTREKETYKDLSEHDALTGIKNRRYFDDKLAELLNIALRYKRPLSLIMFDIDRFKDVNDSYGHETGDLILKELSAVVKEELRNADFFARYGGEEFMVTASETSLAMAKELAERLRLKVEKHDFKIGQTLTCSFGVTEVIEDDTSQSIIYRVDSALYEAKETGRNRVCI